MELDIWGYIAKHIKHDHDRCRLMMTCTWISQCEFWFTEVINIEKILGLEWFDHFRSIYAQKKYKLPKLVTHLSIFFNESINDYIPPTTIHLYFHDKFNQPINGCIPSSVTNLSFYGNFNQPIDKCIPSSVTHLIFQGCYNQYINGYIPSSVTYLSLSSHYERDIINIPSSVTHLKANGIPSYIPTSVTHLELNNKPDYIPTSVCHLTMPGNYSGLIFPLSIINLIFDFYFHPTDSIIPSSITHLQFGIHYGGKFNNKIFRSNIFDNREAINYIPTSVKHLTFGSTFDLFIENCIPSTVTHLTFSKYFTQSIQNNIPSSVVQITFLGKPKELRDDLREYVSKNNIELVFNY